jgi:hypothetical protein
MPEIRTYTVLAEVAVEVTASDVPGALTEAVGLLSAVRAVPGARIVAADVHENRVLGQRP